MKQRSWIEKIAALAIILMPVIYLAYVFKDAPATVPIHFGLDGKADGFGDKSSLWTLVIIMAVTSIGVYLLLNNLPKIDPKKTAKLSQDMFKKMSLAVVIFLAALSIIITDAAINGTFMLNKFLFPLISLFLAYFGNIMISLKPNYFAGIRVPWTLESEDNWKATHRMAGKLWFIGGIVLAVLTLIVPTEAANIFFIIGIAILAIAPIIYSFNYFKKNSKKQSV